MNDERALPPEPAQDLPTQPDTELEDVEPATGTTAVITAGGSRTRWIIAALVAAAVIAGSALIAGLLAGRATPDVLRYVAADSVVAVEFRPELPGDQRAKVGELLSHFPGFADQSTLDRKIDESLDLLVDRFSNGETDYATEVKPYLAGPAVLAVQGLESGTTGDPLYVLVVTTDGTAACHFPVDVTSHTETYKGAEVHVADSGLGVACALDDRTAILGSTASVHGAIDTKRSGRSIADDDSYRAAQDALTGDHLVAAFVNVRAFVDAAIALSPEAPTGTLSLPIDKLPTWAAMQVRAEDDALVLSSVAQLPAGAPAAPGPDHASTLAERLPGSTVAAFEAHDLGASIQTGLDELKDDPATSEMATQIEAAVQMLGGVDALTGWIGDVAIAATLDGNELSGGIVIDATDAAKAKTTLASIRNLIVLAGTGTEIRIDEVDHDGTTIYVVDLGDPSNLFGAPLEVGATEATTITIALAQRDDLVVVGAGRAFAEAVLDVTDGHALADSDRYRHAIDAVGASNSGQGYVDVAALIEYYRSELSGDAAASWDANVKPWVAPFDGVAFSATRDGDHVRGRVALTVR